MVQAKQGTIIHRETIKSGAKDDKKWLLGRIDAEKGYDKITVWADNPDELRTDCDLEIVSISSVAKKNEKYKDKNGEEKWADKYEINATLKVAETSPVPGFTQLTDDSIPF